ncbi:MAG: rhodanese-like domain-containing protein [Betaproteobacteria bacterium]|nr:rhodanese-like domain-containing protein [Betaproteobacteria bacterium]
MEFLLEFVQQNIFLVMIALVSGAMVVYSFIRRADATPLTTAQATLMINRENANVLDVRDAEEFAAGHLPGARNIAPESFSSRTNELEKLKKKPLIIYCKTGQRALKAAADLKKLGFETVFNLEGGINAWTSAGLPIAKAKS